MFLHCGCAFYYSTKNLEKTVGINNVIFRIIQLINSVILLLYNRSYNCALLKYSKYSLNSKYDIVLQ